MGSLLPTLRELVPSDSAAFCWVDERGEISNLYAERMLEPKLMSRYFERYYDRPRGSFRREFLERARAPGGVVATTTDRRMARSAYYKEILRRVDAHHILYGVVGGPDAPRGQVSLYRSKDASPFTSSERHDLASVMRYVSHGVAAAEARRDAELPPLDFEDSGEEALVITDPRGSVRHATDNAWWLLLLCTTSTIDRSSLRDSGRERGRQLLVTLCDRLRAASIGVPAAVPTMAVETHWGRFSLQAYWLRDDSRTADSLVGVRIQRQEPAIVRLVRSMGRLPLSNQQREIVLHIARGRSNTRIADELGVSANTVAYHVKQVFAKLGVHDRAELVARISGAIAPRERRAQAAKAA